MIRLLLLSLIITLILSSDITDDDGDVNKNDMTYNRRRFSGDYSNVTKDSDLTLLISITSGIISITITTTIASSSSSSSSS